MRMRGAARHRWLVALLLLVALAAGVGVAVHADRDNLPTILPYDPLPRW